MKPILDTTFSEASANALAARISNYWADKGYHVVCRVERSHGGKIAQHLSDGTIRTVDLPQMWSVRSDMLNGFPRQRIVFEPATFVEKAA